MFAVVDCSGCPQGFEEIKEEKEKRRRERGCAVRVREPVANAACLLGPAGPDD